MPDTITDEVPGDEASPQLSPEMRRAHNFETWSWLFMRISGLVLLFLALSHFTITHIVNDVVETTSGFVSVRWENPLWRTFDWVLLVLGLLHGLNGLRVITDDYITSPRWLRATQTIMYLITGCLLSWGTYTIVAFKS